MATQHFSLVLHYVILHVFFISFFDNLGAKVVVFLDIVNCTQISNNGAFYYLLFHVWEKFTNYHFMCDSKIRTKNVSRFFLVHKSNAVITILIVGQVWTLFFFFLKLIWTSCCSAWCIFQQNAMLGDVTGAWG